jgi:hypothetical protein
MAGAEKSSGEREVTPRPNLLDIVMIDGRWAQVIFTGNVIKYLDDNQNESIDWDDYILRTKINSCVRIARDERGHTFTAQEMRNMHWGPEDQESPELKDEINVYGIYEKK